MRFKLFGKNIEIDEKLIQEKEEKIRLELEEYVNRERKEFDLNIEFPENFTGKVMRQMAKIPHGETRTYGEIAEKLDSSPVAVGQACGNNPVPLVVPCHRVVGKDSIGGYQYIGIKEKILDLESEK